MRFHVPQFIEKESKLIGPLSLRQFLWFLAGGTVFIIVQFFVSGTWLIVSALVLAGLSAAFAYAKIDGVSLPIYTIRAINFALSSKKYLFTKQETWQNTKDQTPNNS